MNHYLKSLSLIVPCFFYTSLYAITLNQITIADPNQGSKTITYQEKQGYGIVEGDIILGQAEQLRHQGAVIINKVGGTRWPHGIIAFEVAENLPFMNKLAIYQAMDHWQKNTTIEFVELNSKNLPSYPDYISFRPAKGTLCSSYVGRQGGRQEINLSPRCNTMNTVHEIGHALGLWHEQSRADRGSYIKILWENIEDAYKYNFDQQLSNGHDFGEYDYGSIMHYGPYSFSKNGEKTIMPIIEGIMIGQRNHLSDKDIAAIKAMYPEV